MAKKRKKDTTHRVPPLSGVDMAIYVLLAALLAAGTIALLFFWDDLHRWIAFQNAAVIASRPGGSYLVILPLLLLTEIGEMVALMCLWGRKQPIFGRKGIRYGEYPWKTDLFPVLGPRRGKARVAASERRFRKATWRWVWVLRSFCCFPWASLNAIVCGRIFPSSNMTF